jgi:glutamyl-tRNA synthetase
MNVCTRIAPSPTGAPHVGTAYIALFNMCMARKHKGRFLLRMEDTDRQRCNPYYEESIISGMRWLGLDWDAGPDKSDSQNSYRQSERAEIYQKYAQQLLEDGHAFYCFATAQELAEMRASQIAGGHTPRYDGRGLELSTAETQRRLKAGMPYVIRMKVPTEGECTFNDELRGTIAIPWEQVDMQVLIKTDGNPTYHLANVIDDHLSGITHTIRGEEWISSTPKHVLLYRYLGWETPLWCHLPLLRNPDGSKLSKRRNPSSVLYYRDAGYLPEAMVNYLGRMGWSMPDDREQFSIDEMIEAFDLKRISLGSPVFDINKLDWLNSSWMRSLSAKELGSRVRQWSSEQLNLDEFLELACPRVSTMGDLVPLGGFLLQRDLALEVNDFTGLKNDAKQIRYTLQLCVWHMQHLRTDWQAKNIFSGFKKLADLLETPIKDFMAPLFIAVSGSKESIAVTDAMVLMGADMSIHRLQQALELLGNPSKKEIKYLEKLYQDVQVS